MEKFVPVEKRSKRSRKSTTPKQRGSWNGVNPVTQGCAQQKNLQSKTGETLEIRSQYFACFLFTFRPLLRRQAPFRVVPCRPHSPHRPDAGYTLVRRLTGFQAPFPALRRGVGETDSDVLHMTAIGLLLFFFAITSRSLSYFPGHS